MALTFVLTLINTSVRGASFYVIQELFVSNLRVLNIRDAAFLHKSHWEFFQGTSFTVRAVEKIGFSSLVDSTSGTICARLIATSGSSGGIRSFYGSSEFSKIIRTDFLRAKSWVATSNN
jgi:hypothetical protein